MLMILGDRFLGMEIGKSRRNRVTLEPYHAVAVTEGCVHLEVAGTRDALSQTWLVYQSPRIRFLHNPGTASRHL